MHINDRIKRAVVFYISVALFIFLLPIVLSYSLGYKIDYAAFKIYKTGMIYVKSNPSGASIYINGRPHRDITPARIEELKPGAYMIEVWRNGFYPWQKELMVRPNMVTEADDIVLFPIPQEISKMSEREVEDFVISERGQVYYFTGDGLYRSGMDGSGMRRISSYSKWPATKVRYRFSPSEEKFLYFDRHHIWVAHPGPDRDIQIEDKAFLIEDLVKSHDPVLDAFWYSTSNHVVFVTVKNIKVAELKGGAKNIVTLYKFIRRPKAVYYDSVNDSLYFTEGADLYRLDLKRNFFDQLMKRFKKEFETGNGKR